MTGMSTEPRISSRPGLLEVADHESVVARLFRLQRMTDDLRGAAELGQRMEGVIGRIEAVDLEAHARARDTVEQRLEPLDIRSLLDRMDEALVPDPRLILRHCTASYAFSLNMRTACRPSRTRKMLRRKP